MLPVVATFKRTARQIVLYSVLLVACTALFAAVGHMGPFYVRLGRTPRCWLPAHGGPVAAPDDREGRDGDVPLLDHLPDLAVRRHGCRRGDPSPLTCVETKVWSFAFVGCVLAGLLAFGLFGSGGATRIEDAGFVCRRSRVAARWSCRSSEVSSLSLS